MDQELISQTALDQMVSSDQTQLIKAAVPYLPPSARQIISLYTKLEELSTQWRCSLQNALTCRSAKTQLPIRWKCFRISADSVMAKPAKVDQLTNMLILVQMLQILNE